MKKMPFSRAAAACAALPLSLTASPVLACDDCDCDDMPLVATTQQTVTEPAPRNKLGLVRVQGAAPSSLPTNIPTTRETVTREEIERSVNATDSEDALKYLPSLLVRKRYIGDYNHAILSSRASGTGNSARSAVYADGILLSNYLGNGVGGLSFPPRWGLVTPEEIERVDVMYGPFSAAYPGNSVGAVVDYVTRMPTKFEAHAKVGVVSQPFELYNTKTTYRAWAASASLGDRAGDFSWWINVNHTDSDGQPLTFATRLASTGVTGTAGTPVTGAVRMPTVSELYGATATTNSKYINDPNLKPEKSWTAELSAEQGWGAWQSRVTLFAETTRDSLYSQTTFDPVANLNISRVQNVDRIGTTGLEATLGAADWGLKGLDLSGSLTYTDSKIKANTGFVATPGDTVGKWQPNIPRWRATVQAGYRFNAQWSAHLAARYSGPQYRTLNNADVNGYAYQGVSKYATADLRVLWKIDRQWSAAFGVDNLNNDTYWNFHPYPQRSYTAELKFDL